MKCTLSSSAMRFSSSTMTPRAYVKLQNGVVPPEQTKPIVAVQPEDCDQQLQSPLYDGRIPPEIRNLIFDYALTEYVVSLYRTDTHYTRPNFVGKKKIAINLLLMCKRSYLETRHLPPVKKTHTFWHRQGPPGQRYWGDELGYFRRFQPAQLALVKEIHLFTQQWWLERQLRKVFRLDVLQGIEKVKITLRKGDWRCSDMNVPLAISPQISALDERSMKEVWSREKAGEIVIWNETSWGSAFRHLTGLKELEMEFETDDYRVNELDDIMSHAVMWKFPMGNGKFLSADGLGGVKTSSWRGPPSAWSKCPSCVAREYDYREGGRERLWDEYACTFCEKMKNIKRRPGPMLIIRSLRWRLADAK